MTHGTTLFHQCFPLIYTGGIPPPPKKNCVYLLLQTFSQFIKLTSLLLITLIKISTLQEMFSFLLHLRNVIPGDTNSDVSLRSSVDPNVQTSKSIEGEPKKAPNQFYTKGLRFNCSLRYIRLSH